MSRTKELVININGQLCIAKNDGFKSLGAFAEAFMYGINDLLDKKINEYFQIVVSTIYGYDKGFCIKTNERSEENYQVFQIKSFENLAKFRQRIRPMIYDLIVSEISLWWNSRPEISKFVFDPLADTSNPFVAHNIQPVKWPTFSVEFDDYRKEFVRDKRLEDIELFILWMTMEIPGLARIAQKMAIDNFNAGRKHLNFSFLPLGFFGNDDQSAEEFGESVRQGVRTILFEHINTVLKRQLEEEEQFGEFIDAEVDPKMFADVPNDDETRYAELLANPPEWFMAELSPK